MSVGAYIATIVLALLAVFAAPFGGLSALELLALAVASFALAHVLPR